MPLKTQGIILSVETALATTKPITAASVAKPPILTATAHGYSQGDIIKILNVVGMSQLNNRAFQVDLTAAAASPLTNKFALKGIDATNIPYGTYISGGDTYKATMTPVGSVSGIPTLFTGTAPTIDVTSLTSVAQEFIMGLQTFGSSSVDLIFDDADAAQIVMQAAKEAAIPKCFSVKAVDGKVACFLAYVTDFSITAPQNQVMRATVALLLAGAPSPFA